MAAIRPMENDRHDHERAIFRELLVELRETKEAARENAQRGENLAVLESRVARLEADVRRDVALLDDIHTKVTRLEERAVRQTKGVWSLTPTWFTAVVTALGMALTGLYHVVRDIIQFLGDTR